LEIQLAEEAMNLNFVQLELLEIQLAEEAMNLNFFV
jgi:hypothetical protein